MTLTTTITSRFIGRCTVKGCTHTIRVNDSDTIRQAWGRSGQWPTINDEPRCPNHPSLVLKWKHIHGTHNPDKTCTAKCLGATGPICECECGGENHGGAHG